MNSQNKPKAKRIIGFYNSGSGLFKGGLTMDLCGHNFNDLLDLYGRVNPARVRSNLNSLKIGATEKDCEEFCEKLNAMRISEHAHPVVDEVFDDLDMLSEKIPLAIDELSESNPSKHFAVEAALRALVTVRESVEAARLLRVWEKGKGSWYDDAFLIAQDIHRIARRNRTTSKLHFKSPMGPTVRVVSQILELGGVVARSGQPHKEDAIRKALAAHPMINALPLP